MLSKLLHKFRRSSTAPREGLVPFHIRCVCNAELTGTRLPHHQVVICPQCQRKRFILPQSPLPPVEKSAEPATPATPGPRRLPLRYWLLPITAAALTAGVLAIVFVRFLPSRTAPVVQPRSLSAADSIERVQTLLQQGRFRLAAEQIEAAQRTALIFASPQESRRWTQLTREAGIYADLCAEPIEALLEHASNTPEEEWLADFAVRYRGKAIIFDALVTRGRHGGRLDYTIRSDQGPVDLMIESLGFLEMWNIDESRRVIFGARLGSIKLEPPGPNWRVRFIPDSDVLLTDPVAAVLCCPAFADDDARKLLQRQEQMVK